ncbi:MAG: hypothetical protein GKS03_06430 [Alphaproteobacteria bacterium]|nr:hypothetical protein [Alphaproteobacteria bacterium]
MKIDTAKLRLWYARAVMTYAVLIFAFLSALYAFNPLAGIDMFGVSLSGEAHSITFLRTSLGAMFSGLFFASAIGIVRPRLFMTCLTIVVGFMTMIVALRLYGLTIDGVTPKNLSELRNEGLSLLVFMSGWIAHASITGPRDQGSPA